MNSEEKPINSIEKLPNNVLEIGPKLKDIRDSLSDALGDYEMMIRKFRGSMVKNRELIESFIDAQKVALQENAERLQEISQDLEKAGQKLTEDRELITAMQLISSDHCKKQAKTGPCTHCIFLKKDKGCVLAAYFPNGWEEQMEEE